MTSPPRPAPGAGDLGPPAGTDAGDPRPPLSRPHILVVNGRVVEATDKQAEREQLTLMLDNGDLRTIDLSAAASIRFTDPQLQRQFKDYLAAVSAARSITPKRGAGTSAVRTWATRWPCAISEASTSAASA